MKESTAILIHKAYNESLRKSSNIIEIVQNLYEILDKAVMEDQEEERIVDSFLDGLRGCYNVRLRTFEITNFASYLNITIMYIVLWLNSKMPQKIDVSLNARRKALESDLTKILKKSICKEVSSYIVRDRFGLRAIIWNEDEEEAIQMIYKLYDCIVGIIAGKSRKMKKDFATWIESNPRIGLLDKKIVLYILDIPFGVESKKDYIMNPKSNGYMTLQFTVTVQMYSELLPGTQLEIQLRTKRMHDEAEHGKANHFDYKEEMEELTQEEKEWLKKTFVVDEFESLNIPGFTGYTKDRDVDGVHFPKEFFDRRLSATLVPEN